MKKSDLKTGMKVVTRDNSVYIVLLDAISDYTEGYREYKTSEGFLVNPNDRSFGWNSLHNYKDGMTSDSDHRGGDIVEVSIPGHPYDIFYQHNGYRVIWKREDKSESQKQLDNVMYKLAELQKEAEQLQETIKKEKK